MEKDEIFRQMLALRFGNGVDILIGKDRAAAEAAFAKSGKTAAQAFAGAGYLFSDDPSVLTPETRRAAIIRDEDYAFHPRGGSGHLEPAAQQQRLFPDGRVGHAHRTSSRTGSGMLSRWMT